MNALTVTLGGAIELLLRPAPPEITAIVTTRFGGFSVTARGTDMAYNLPSGMMVESQINYVDAGGNPAVVDGLVSWSSSDTSIVTVTVDGTESTMCTIAAVGPVGTAQVTATADADLGTGTRALVTLLAVNVVAGEAVAGTITIIGEPQPIVPA